MSNLWHRISLKFRFMRASRLLKKLNRLFFDRPAGAWGVVLDLSTPLTDMHESGIPAELIAQTMRKRTRSFSPALQDILGTLLELSAVMARSTAVIDSAVLRSGDLDEAAKGVLDGINAQSDALEIKLGEQFSKATGFGSEEMKAIARERTEKLMASTEKLMKDLE